MTSVSPQIIDLRETAPSPWKNGAGVTREIAVEPAGASLNDFDWRISVAEISGDAPFSVFAGIERCIVLLRGAGMCLLSERGAINARLNKPLEPFRFSGEEPLTATLIDGACTDFNVMVRKARWRAEVTEAHRPQDIEAASAALVFCVQGSSSIQVAAHPKITLREGQAALWRTSAPARTLHVDTPDTHLLIVQLNALCQNERT